jgi:DNA-directed RNA polymerase subunit M/transcription elongation factor TFIIS
MSLSKLTCPECGTTMRPKVPVPPGKKVRCPKCQAVFAARAEVDEVEEIDEVDEVDEVEEVRPRKKVPAKAAKAKAAPPPPPKKKNDEEEQTYGYIRDDDEEDEEVKERKKINYAPDESIRDLRGPAIVALRQPTGFLTLAGFVGAGGWILFILLMAIPFSFPIPEEEKKNDLNAPPGAQQPGGAKPAGPVKSAFHIWWNLDFYNGVINNWGGGKPGHPAIFWLIILGFGVLALYSWIIALGSIKLINLESRVFGIVSSIMAMLPINVLGLTFALAFGIQFGLRQIEIDEDSINWFTIGIGIVLWIVSAAVGVWTLIVANSEVVKEGFDYQPE